MNSLTWQQWLESRDIDCQTLTPELEAALQSQYEADCQRLAPVGEKLVLPIDCSWPARCFWVPTAEPAL